MKLAVFVDAMCDDKGKSVSDETAFVWRVWQLSQRSDMVLLLDRAGGCRSLWCAPPDRHP